MWYYSLNFSEIILTHGFVCRYNALTFQRAFRIAWINPLWKFCCFLIVTFLNHHFLLFTALIISMLSYFKVTCSVFAICFRKCRHPSWIYPGRILLSKKIFISISKKVNCTFDNYVLNFLVVFYKGVIQYIILVINLFFTFAFKIFRNTFYVVLRFK